MFDFQVSVTRNVQRVTLRLTRYAFHESPPTVAINSSYELQTRLRPARLA